MPDTLNIFGTEYTNVTGIIAKDDNGVDLTFTRGGSGGGGGEPVLIEKSITANGTYAASSDNADGYSSVTVSVSGGTPRSSTDLIVSGATVTAPAGVYAQDATKSVASGTVTAPTIIGGTAATISTGTNTLTLSKTVSVTPTVSTAGYVSSGTAGNSSVSLTASVTTKGATTYTPTTTNQTIASGTYLTGAQTISGDANLVAGNIKSGTTIFGVTGSYTGGGSAAQTATGTFSGSGSRSVAITCSFEPDLVYWTSDPGTSASSGTVAGLIARGMMASNRYRNNSTTNSANLQTPITDMNTGGSSYNFRATYADGKVTIYCFSSNARSLFTSGRTYSYTFVKWTA